MHIKLSYHMKCENIFFFYEKLYTVEFVAGRKMLIENSLWWTIYEVMKGYQLNPFDIYMLAKCQLDYQNWLTKSCWKLALMLYFVFFFNSFVRVFVLLLLVHIRMMVLSSTAKRLQFLRMMNIFTNTYCNAWTHRNSDKEWK